MPHQWRTKTFSNSKIATDSNSIYLRALYSFSPQYNSDLNNWFSTIIFLKLLYAENLTLAYKRRLSRDLFKTLLTGSTKLPNELIYKILLKIDEEFELLGDANIKVKEDLLDALSMFGYQKHFRY